MLIFSIKAYFTPPHKNEGTARLPLPPAMSRVTASPLTKENSSWQNAG